MAPRAEPEALAAELARRGLEAGRGKARKGRRRPREGRDRRGLCSRRHRLMISVSRRPPFLEHEADGGNARMKC